MALVLDPNFFSYTLYRYDQETRSFCWHSTHAPKAADIFRITERKAHPPERLLPRRAFPIVEAASIGDERVLILWSKDSASSLHWTGELFSHTGHRCERGVYDRLWGERKIDNTAFLAFDTSHTPMGLHIAGRMLEAVVFLVLFEAPDEEHEVIQGRLWNASGMVSAHIRDLSVMVEETLTGEGRGYAHELAIRHPAARALIEVLKQTDTPKRPWVSWMRFGK